MKRLLLIVTLSVLAGACGSSTRMPEQKASSITFQLHNDGIATVYLFESCQIDFTITSLADPAHTIGRAEGCVVCECGQPSCPICGACFEGPRDVAVGSLVSESWTTVDVTTQTTSTGSCQRLTALPDGPYRIDVPVYPTAEDAAAGTFSRTAIQSFNLPVSGNVVDVALGVSP